MEHTEIVLMAGRSAKVIQVAVSCPDVKVMYAKVVRAAGSEIISKLVIHFHFQM